MRTLHYSDAIREALEIAMEADERVYVMGLGATDPKGIFGTTLGLEQRFGAKRVLDMPVAENGMTGVAIGSALVGMRPIMIHQRIDFALLACDQIINSAAKWNFMFAGRQSVPLVIRLLIGRGWGQGPQHSQSLQALFSHIPGLKVVMPATPYDAKGMLLAAIEDPNPVIFIEHRWLHSTFGHVPTGWYTSPISQAAIARPGRDISLIVTSLARLEALQAAEVLIQYGIDAEVVDMRSVKPIDYATILGSVAKTRRALAVDHGWRTAGIAGEVLATIAQECFHELRSAPRRLTAPDSYVSTAPSEAAAFYPTPLSIINETLAIFDQPPISEATAGLALADHRDVPDATFRGPF